MQLSLSRRPAEDDALRVLLTAIDSGADLVDTADAYCLDESEVGHNERLVARALRLRPERRVVVATKVGFERTEGRWIRNGRPEYLKRACEASLRALGVDELAILHLHSPDREIPFEESVGALADLQREGKVRHVGLSNVTLGQLRVARSIVPVISVQNRCHVLCRTSWEGGVVQYCEEEGIAFVAYCPVGGLRDRERIARNATLTEIGDRCGATPHQIALAWLLGSSPALIAIPGAGRVESVTASAAALTLDLDSPAWEALDAAFPTSSSGC